MFSKFFFGSRLQLQVLTFFCVGDWHHKLVRVLLEKKEERELIYCPPKYPILPSPIKGVSNDEYSRMMSQITTNAFQKGNIWQ
jgi:hypothetical protein